MNLAKEFFPNYVDGKWFIREREVAATVLPDSEQQKFLDYMAAEREANPTPDPHQSNSRM